MHLCPDEIFAFLAMFPFFGVAAARARAWWHRRHQMLECAHPTEHPVKAKGDLVVRSSIDPALVAKVRAQFLEAINRPYLHPFVGGRRIVWDHLLDGVDHVDEPEPKRYPPVIVKWSTREQNRIHVQDPQLLVRGGRAEDRGGVPPRQDGPQGPVPQS